MKVLINFKEGGFSLTDAGRREFVTRQDEYFRKNWKEKLRIGEHMILDYSELATEASIERKNPILIKMIEENGELYGPSLKVVEIPEDIGDDWYIEDFDGRESVHENHRIFE